MGVEIHSQCEVLYARMDVAMGTISGHLFYPDTCHGAHPRVCYSGIVFNQGEELCTHGLSSGNEKWKLTC